MKKISLQILYFCFFFASSTACAAFLAWDLAVFNPLTWGDYTVANRLGIVVYFLVSVRAAILFGRKNWSRND